MNITSTSAPLPSNTIPSEISAIDPRELRNALGKFATGVCVITTRSATGKLEGLTANSFSSVSLEPAIVSWSLKLNAGSLETFLESSHFCINLLGADQVDISRHFCKPQVDKFEGMTEQFESGIAGMPKLRQALATFECRQHSYHEVGDHIVFYGQVERYSYDDVEPLAFHGGKYASLNGAL
jgi:flavin reductase (DIM6/NTAB) family NADH-FMN oxidoreductase RutF